jgi:hypothetical protein
MTAKNAVYAHLSHKGIRRAAALDAELEGTALIRPPCFEIKNKQLRMQK